MEKYQRKCPKCEKSLTYSEKGNFKKALFKNCLCNSCAQKSYTHSNKYPITERKCPSCGEMVKHKSRACMLRSWKKNKICKYCMRKKLGKANYNPKACEYFNQLNEENKWNLQHAMNGGETNIITGKFSYWLDAYDRARNIVVEYDEPIHYDKETGQLRIKDSLRQNDIIKFLKCQFYRFSETTNQLLNVTSGHNIKEINSTCQISVI